MLTIDLGRLQWVYADAYYRFSFLVQVDDQLLEGFTNQESVDILRNTGQVVRLKLVRYKYGRKHDLLTRSTGQFRLLSAICCNRKIYGCSNKKDYKW